MRVPFWLIPLLNRVARGFDKLAERCEAVSRQLGHCECCGENRWYGKSCTEVERINLRTPRCKDRMKGR